MAPKSAIFVTPCWNVPSRPKSTGSNKHTYFSGACLAGAEDHRGGLDGDGRGSGRREFKVGRSLMERCSDCP